MLVLAVLAVLIGLAYPLVSAAFERQFFDEAVDKVRLRLAGTRIYAVDSGAMYQFRYEKGGRKFLVIPFEVDNDVDAATAISERYRWYSGELPEGMWFDDVISDWEKEHGPDNQPPIPIAEELVASLPEGKKLLEANWASPVLFRPDGEAEGVLQFAIKDEQKRSVTLSVRPLTAAVSVGDVVQEGR